MADQKEFFNEHQLEYAIRRGHEDLQSRLWTSLPVKVVSFNATEQSCKVQPLIQSKVRQKDGSFVDQDMPGIIDVPVHFPSAGGWTLTHPLKPGDEGVAHFQSRCIDKWWLPPENAQQGAPQPQSEMRMHDWNDAVFQPGIRSKPRWLKNVSTTTPQWRSDDGKSYIELASGSNGGACNMVFPDGVTITCGQTKIEVTTGSVRITTPKLQVIGGEIQAEKEVTSFYGTAGSVTSSHHRHKQDADSHSDTEQDVRAPTPGT